MQWKAVAVAVASLLVGLWPAGASGYDCTIGGEQVAVTSALIFREDYSGRIVMLEGSTTRSIEDSNNCPGWVRVEGWIEGDPSGARSHQSITFARLGYPGTIGAAISVGCPAAMYRAHTKHWFIRDGYFGDPWASIANRDPTADVPACAQPPTEAELCSLQGPDYYWNGSECVYTPGSPIIVDTARDGYQLTGIDDGVRFDLNVDGIRELIAWTAAGSDDAFLAIDRNGNGQIDDGSELIGNYTRAYADRDDVRTNNGFEALKFLEGPSYGRSNGDGTIDARDAIFGRLLLWRDLNHNGISEPDELQTVGAAGVASIGTEYKEKRRIDRFGNEFRQKSRIIWADGVEDAIFDVWLKRRE